MIHICKACIHSLQTSKKVCHPEDIHGDCKDFEPINPWNNEKGRF